MIKWILNWFKTKPKKMEVNIPPSDRATANKIITNLMCRSRINWMPKKEDVKYIDLDCGEEYILEPTAEDSCIHKCGDNVTFLQEYKKINTSISK